MKHQFGSSSRIRFAAMMISFPLAMGLYQRVDQPIRKFSESRSRITFIGLAVMTLAPLLISATYLRIIPNVDLEIADNLNSQPDYSLGSKTSVDVAIPDLKRIDCISGSIISSKKLLLIGDSHASSISEPVISAYLKIYPEGSVFVWSKSGCPFLVDDNSNKICDVNRDFVNDLIRSEKPSEIIISNAITRYLNN